MMGKECIVCKEKIGRLNSSHKLKDACGGGVDFTLFLPDEWDDDYRVCNDCYSEHAKIFAERVREYKKKWNKSGVVQFRNERVAILRRVWGSQVEFIIAYDDLTKNGYRCVAQDEGKQAGDGITGGVDSYYYFQKIECVSCSKV